ncbi:hypothetical protein GQ44DRAFT_824170 [Phaeosphaeriaceae sp. PMI808]|nr:hypothetical protein GQ44DRAFT_824170 [Phaeosphaeriaceae sp. PMI808]
MKYHLFSLFSSFVLCHVAAALPATGSPRTPSASVVGDCQKTLSCSLAEIEALSTKTRLAYIKNMQADFFGPLNAGNQFRAIQGVVQFLSTDNLGNPNSWISYIDASILEGIQNGGANALGLHNNDGGNPGTKLWAEYLRTMKRGGYSTRDQHDFAWASSEQSSTTHGKQIADQKFKTTAQENLWFVFTQVFRWIMRNKGASVAAVRTVILTGSVVNPPLLLLLPQADDFVNWLTDITNPKPAECFSRAAWDVVDLNNIAVLPIELFKTIVPELLTCFKNR